MTLLTWTLLTLLMTSTIVNGQALYRGDCPNPPIEEVFQVDRFLGRWFEVERTFALFEATLRCISSEYFLREDGKLGIRNIGVNSRGREQTITGHALAKDPQHPAQLTVYLQGVLFPANLTVLHTDYRNFAVLWSCNELLLGHTENMWILARKPYLDEDLKLVLYNFLIQTGVGLKGLKMVEQSHCPHRKVNIPEEPEEVYVEAPEYGYDKKDLNHQPGSQSHNQPEPQSYHQPDQQSYHQPDPQSYQQPEPQSYQQPDPQSYQQPLPPSHHQPLPPPYQQPQNYHQHELRPNAHAQVQLGQTFQPHGGEPQRPDPIPHYHDAGKAGTVYEKPSQDFAHDRPNGNKVYFNEDPVSPREVDQHHGYQQDSVKSHSTQEQPRTYRDRKDYREEDTGESRQGRLIKEPLQASRNSTDRVRLTPLNENKNRSMEYYQYQHEDDGTRNGTRRLRRPSLEDDLRQDKDKVRFLELTKDPAAASNSTSVLFIHTKSHGENRNEKVVKRSIKVVFD